MLQGSPLGSLSNGCYLEDPPGFPHGPLLEEQDIPEEDDIGEEEAQLLMRERRR